MGGSPRPTLGYGDAVPAVVRALAVLEHLSRAPSGRALSQLSRDLSISPSSLLAILRTLQSRGYVERNETSGGYGLGPALAKLAATTEDADPLRAAATAVSELAHVQAVLSNAGDPERRAELRRALGRAGQHLADALLASTDEKARREFPDRAPVPWGPEASGPLVDDALDAFLNGGWLATLSCLKENGYPYSVPVWYHWEDGVFWVIPRPGAEWARYLDHNPRVSLAISEPGPPMRRVLAEGWATALAGADRAERIQGLATRMATRYLGPAAPEYLAMTTRPGHAFGIAPEKLVTWRGLASHPRYQPPGDEPNRETGVA